MNSSAATFDAKKLEWMNGEHIRARPLADLVADVLPFARERYGSRLDIPRFEAAVALAQARATTLVEIAEQAGFLFTPDAELAIDDAVWQKVAATDRVGELYDAVLAHLEACDWTLEAIDPRPVVTELELKVKPAMKALYTAIEGRESGLPLFDSMLLLGRESTVARLRAARARLA